MFTAVYPCFRIELRYQLSRSYHGCKIYACGAVRKPGCGHEYAHTASCCDSSLGIVSLAIEAADIPILSSSRLHTDAASPTSARRRGLTRTHNTPHHRCGGRKQRRGRI